MSRDRRQEDDYEIGSARDYTAGPDSVGRSALKLPSGAQLWQPKQAKVYRIDVIPFRAGKGNPDAAPGKIFYYRYYSVHRNIGPNQEAVCCPAKCSNQPCPVCKDLNEQWNEWRTMDDGAAKEKEKKRLKGMNTKDRQIFNIIDRDDPDAGIQIWDVSYHLFGKALREKLENQDPDEDYDYFHHPKRGYYLRIIAAEKSVEAGGKPFLNFENFEFKARKEPYEMSIIDKAYCLDDMVKVMAYDDLEKLYLQVPETDKDDKKPSTNGERHSRKPARDDDDDDAPAPKKATPRSQDDDEPAPKKRPPVDDDDKPARRSGKEVTADEVGIKQGQLVMYGKLECEVLKVSRDGTSLTLEDPEGETLTAISPADVKKWVPDNKRKSADDDEPAPKKRALSTDDDDDDAPRKRHPDDDDDDDKPVARKRPADDDDEPAPKKAGKKSVPDDDDDDGAPPAPKRGWK
jgi:hypothetical protein